MIKIDNMDDAYYFADKSIIILTNTQQMHCYNQDELYKIYPISTAKKGLGELQGSYCTPRGWHRIHRIIGNNHLINSVFVGREWTGEIYNKELEAKFPTRDWILSRILWLEGLEPGRNRGGLVDTLARFIYIHGAPDKAPMQTPASHGCIRMHNIDVIELAKWAQVGTLVDII